MSKNNKPTAMVHVGVSRETIVAARDALLQFVNAKASDAVIIEALRTFKDVVSVNGTVIQNCSFVSE